MSVSGFGRMPDGTLVNRYVLRSESIEVSVIPYGARIVSVLAPDRCGTMADVVLGFDTLDDYVAPNPYFGAVVGRYANRIAGASFRIDDRDYALVANDGRNCLHGGDGLDTRLWEVAFEGSVLVLSCLSPDGESGFPGNLRVEVRYSVKGSDLHVDYTATTDKPTVVNLSNHAYFNLSGMEHAGCDVLQHALRMPAAFYLAVDEDLIPEGLPKVVADTPFDFTNCHAIGERVAAPHRQIAIGHGYDHCWVIGKSPASRPRTLAWLQDPGSGRTLEVLSTEPGIQFYSGNFLDGSIVGKRGMHYGRHAGLCLEPQHFPDSPNRPDFPSTLLRPEDIYRSWTIYRFGTGAPLHDAGSSS